MKENWTYKKLGDIATFSRGLTFAKGDVADMSSKKVLRSNNIDLSSHSLNFDDVACLNEDFVIPDEKKLHKGDIFICMSNGSTQHLGKVAFIEEDLDYAFGGFMGAIHPNQSETNPKFVFYACCSSEYRRFLASVFNGVNINNLKWSDLSKFSIPVPPIETQSRIVSELDLLQSIIDKQQAQLKELDTLAQAVFFDMFGQPKEKGFAVVSLGQIAVLKAGYTPSEDDLFDNGCYPYFKVGDMNTEGNQKFLSITKSYANPPKKVFPKDSIVFPKNGAAIGTNKKRILAQESIVDLNTAVLICDKTQVVINYIYSWLLTIDFKDHTRRGAVPTLDAKELMCLQLPLPSFAVQQVFSDKIDAIEKQKAAISQSMAETQKLFDYTMDKYFG